METRAYAVLAALLLVAAGAAALVYSMTAPHRSASRVTQPAASTPSAGGLRSGTAPARLQERLDRGGLIFLPKLAGGDCYRTRGLWVRHSDTTIESDGACLTVTGPGPVRLESSDGDPIPATAALFVAHGSPGAPQPQNVTIRGLHIHVAAAGLDGIDVYAEHVRIEDVTVDGSPLDDVYIGGRRNVAPYSSDVTVTGSTLLDARRNGISVTAAIAANVEWNTIARAGRSMGAAANPGDGIDVEPNRATDPIQQIRIAHNTIAYSERKGIELTFGGGPPPSGAITIAANTIVGGAPS